MEAIKYVRHESISLRDSHEYNEKWLQKRIAEDASILGLGELEVIDVERPQPKAGRLDMLLRDPETRKRYEVEIMLGAVDESHIVRTIEYWDIERKRYPQYEHCAVIVAETINARFVNVIQLFNSVIPIVAIQLNALRVEDALVLSFTKVLDEVKLGLEEDDDTGGPGVDRAYWEQRASKRSLAMVDDCLGIVREVDPALELNYNKYYVGLAKAGAPNNFVVFRPKKQWLRIEPRVLDQETWVSRLEEAGVTVLPGEKIRERLVLQVRKEDIDKNRSLFGELFAQSYQEQNG